MTNDYLTWFVFVESKIFSKQMALHKKSLRQDIGFAAGSEAWLCRAV